MQRYDVVFKGEITGAIPLIEVKSRLAKALKASHSDVERLFSGGQLRLKKNVDVETASRVKAQLERIGAVAEVVPVEDSLELTLSEIEPVSAPPEPSPSPVAYQSAPSTSNVSAPHANQERQKTSDFSHLFSGKFLLSIALLVFGLICLILFFPWPDGIVRRGFILSVICLLIGLKTMHSALSWERG